MSATEANVVVDRSVFDGLLDMDDDPVEREFSKDIAVQYCQQTKGTLVDIQLALRSNDIESLGRLGHFQKGSSSALGLRKVQSTCELIQNLGRRVDQDGNALLLSDAEILAHLDRLVAELFAVNREAENWLKEFFKM
ncbi:signal transduction histidine kinase [Chytriomyces cf. hyalinus JEL632]|nr:signal transduction histidine kinase [Chytriomyces cf. hyalinus JEL632]